MQLSHPNQVTAQVHGEILSELRQSLAGFSGRGSVELRDWDFTIVEGVPTVQIFLDKGLKHPSEGRMEGVLLDECAGIHHYLMENNAFSCFADELSFEVGSAGICPRLREMVDFACMVGCWVSVETWERIENRRKYVMILDGVDSDANSQNIRLREGDSRFSIPVSAVRRAEALLDRTETAGGSKRAPKRSKKG